MCRKREEMALVQALMNVSGQSRSDIRTLLAKGGHLIRHVYRKKQFPIPQHLVEDMCVTIVDHFGQITTSEELAVETISFLSLGTTLPI